MAIVIEDMQVEQLAQKLAADAGVTVTEVLRASLLSLAGLRRSNPVVKKTLRERLAALVLEVDALPKSAADNFSDNNILGYSAVEMMKN